MPETGLLLALAEIAGVFVGFGALISVRSSNTADPHTVLYLRAVTWMGLWVVVAALVPAGLTRYGVEGRALWLSCSLFALVLFLVLWAVDARSPEMAAERASAPRALTVRYMAVVLPLTLLLHSALILVVIGAWPKLEAAFYSTAVTLGLFLAGMTLLLLVFSLQPTRAPESSPLHHRQSGSTTSPSSGMPLPTRTGDPPPGGHTR